MIKLNLFVNIIILMYKESIVLSQFFANITRLWNFLYLNIKKKENTGWNKNMQKYKEHSKKFTHIIPNK